MSPLHHEGNFRLVEPLVISGLVASILSGYQSGWCNFFEPILNELTEVFVDSTIALFALVENLISGSFQVAQSIRALGGTLLTDTLNTSVEGWVGVRQLTELLC